MEFKFIDPTAEMLVHQANFYVAEESRLRTEMIVLENQFVATRVLADEREKVEGGTEDLPFLLATLERLESEHSAMAEEYKTIKPKADKAQKWLAKHEKEKG